ncbi:MAG: hypothetical protein HY558_01460 [Euryarchaeota archaeon]|nr:hypothetical protein [Euryarchaeota archaeon]
MEPPAPPLPERVQARLRALAAEHHVEEELLRGWYLQYEASDLIRERFQGLPGEERVDYMLLILEERLGEHGKRRR